MTAVAAACLMLAACGGTSAQEAEDGSQPVTERRAVSPDGVSLASPSELGVDVPSCNGAPVVDELIEEDEQVSIRVVTTMVVSGPSDACSDALTVTLEGPLDGRDLIDLVSGETLTVTPRPDVDPDSLVTRTERRPVSLAGWEVSQFGPNDLSFDVPSCNGDPVVDELVEDGGYVRIKIVTTVVVSGDAADCLDSLDVSLRDPLGDRPIIDWESGETLPVVPLDVNPGSLGGLCEEMEVALAEGEPGRDSPEEAIEAFVANENGFLADVTFDGEQIVYQDEVVGQVVVRSMPAGGHLVTSAQWCYPDDY